MTDTITIDRPETGTITPTHEEPRTAPAEPGDHERFSHYVDAVELTKATINGTPVVALCGKVWVPSRDPKRFPVCPECKDAWEQCEDDTGDDGTPDR
jgi:hypothetical protein